MAVRVANWDDLLVGEELAHLSTEPARAARRSPLPDDLDPRLREALAAAGVTELFAHQAEAWEAAARGEHLIVTTGTASGKTLCVQPPGARRRSRATQAPHALPLPDQGARPGPDPQPQPPEAARSQAGDLRRGHAEPGALAGAQVGQSDPDQPGHAPRRRPSAPRSLGRRPLQPPLRRRRRGARLPGVFGSHVANVLRRLRRLARIYGADPQFLFASATIANPGELAQRLLGVDAAVIDVDAAPKAERAIALWNPPLTDEELGLRASALGEASRLMAALVERGVRTLCFAKSRRSSSTASRLSASATRPGCRPTAPATRPRSGGKSSAAWSRATARRQRHERARARDRRRPARLRDLRRLSRNRGKSAPAVGPRRADGSGLAVLVASEDALDQFFMREPEALPERRVEAAILDYANPRVLDGHVRAAAFEARSTRSTRRRLGPPRSSGRSCRPATHPERLRLGGTRLPGGTLRPAVGQSRAVQRRRHHDRSLLGLVERERAYSTVHGGAVYLHLGESYRVLDLDLEAGPRSSSLSPGTSTRRRRRTR